MPEAFRHSTLHASLQCVNTHYVNKTHFHNRFALVTSRRLKRSCTLDFLFFMEKWFEIVFFIFLVFLCYLCRRNAAGPSPTCSSPTPPSKKTHLLQRFVVSLWALMTTHIRELRCFKRLLPWHKNFICALFYWLVGDLWPPHTVTLSIG